MNFDFIDLNYLNIQLVEILKNKDSQITAMAIEEENEELVLIKVFESSESEKHVYKMYKILQDEQISPNILLRD